MKSESLSRLVVDMTMQRLAKECDHSCESEFASILHQHEPANLVLLKFKRSGNNNTNFSFNANCSIKIHLAKGMTQKSQQFVWQEECYSSKRNILMLALQHITGLILFHGDVSKMVSNLVG